MPRNSKTRDRLTLFALGLASVLIVLRIAIPEGPHGVGTAHFGQVDQPLNIDCLLTSVAELDAGAELIRWRGGVRVAGAQRFE